MKSHARRFGSASAATALVAVAALTGCSAGDIAGGDESDDSTLTFLVDNSEDTAAAAESLADAFEASHEGVTVDVETRPQGAEGDNVVKTRLSTGDMTDVFMYNAGSLFQAIDPETNLVPLGDAVGYDDVEESFLETVTAGDQPYGVPYGAAQGGGIMYNKAIYDELGLDVPMTWDEFMANNKVIKAAGKAPIIQTYQETWTSQLFVLGDFHNVAAADPEWADKYTANEVKYSDPPAIEGFEHLQEISEAGYLNEDFASANLTDGLDELAAGEGAHYPILSGVLPTLTDAHPDAAEDIGFFAIPGEDASQNGLTVWPGLAGVYIPKTTEGEKLELAEQFLDFVASPEGCDAQTEAAAPTGPYLVQGCELPDDVPPAVTDIQKYFRDGNVTPALEYLSPVKGPALEQLCVEVGSGIKTADESAALYDQDVEKQAQQLGLPGW